MGVKMLEIIGSEGRQRQVNILQMMPDSLLVCSIFFFL